MILAGVAAAALAVAALGVAGLVGIRRWSVVVGAAVSLLLLGLYFHPRLSAGVAIGVGLLIAVLVFQWPTNEALGI